MARIKAAEIDAPCTRVAARLIKRFDPAGLTEQVLRCARTEAIRLQSLLTAQKRKILMAYNQMLKARLGADRAIAIQQFHRWLNLNSKAYRAAVTAALQPHSTVTDLARLRG